MKIRYTVVLAMLVGFGLGAVAAQYLHAQATLPAYTVAEVEVTDPATYQQYIAVGVPPSDGRFIAREREPTSLTASRQNELQLSSGKALTRRSMSLRNTRA